ncbi:hypothetical protein TWF481_002242 [Arthrobotrys musiformis]|uniref:HNH nuclease domain-containing protein n=1 Tax=Arthrobotrys musiformis TaxID=47236 RepID=A0AAV9VUA4_9PEZI
MESMCPISDSPVQLESLSLRVRLLDPTQRKRFRGIWLLDTLTHLLPACVTKLKRLDFNFPRYTPLLYDPDISINQYGDQGKRQEHLVKHINPSGRTIPLPALRYLKILLSTESPAAFSAYINANRDTLEEIDVGHVLSGHSKNSSADVSKPPHPPYQQAASTQFGDHLGDN